VRPIPVRLPSWLPAVVGVVLTSGFAVVALGGPPLPRWLAPREVRTGASVAESASRAEAVWRAAVQDIARAKGVAPGEALLGSELTPLVTTLGGIEAKRVSASPVWARVLVAELDRAGVRRGDIVAASFSGSFPGLNLAVASACQSLGVSLIAVSSVTASSWGASDAGFTWPEIEVRLAHDGILIPVSVAISAGGDGDRALDLEEGGRRLAGTIAARCATALGAQLLEPMGFEEALRLRFDAYDAARGSRPLAAFINVGGTEASLGLSPAILRVKSGWLAPSPFDSSPRRGLVARMVERGVPVLHLLNVRDLALRWGVL
jgi:poly-gamma-glutamate system protein